jgi:hypothetical protein
MYRRNNNITVLQHKKIQNALDYFLLKYVLQDGNITYRENKKKANRKNKKNYSPFKLITGYFVLR